MSRRILSVFLALLISPTTGKTVPRPSSDEKAGKATPVSCPVTIGRKSDISPAEFFGSGSAYWNDSLYVGGLWPDGTIVFKPGGAGFVYPDGSVGMKIAWYRANGLHGRLVIKGKRLDAVAPPLRAEIPDGYSDTGFQPSGVIFPTEGCWQVTGTVGSVSVTFVTRVVKLPGLKVNATHARSADSLRSARSHKTRYLTIDAIRPLHQLRITGEMAIYHALAVPGRVPPSTIFRHDCESRISHANAACSRRSPINYLLPIARP